MLRGDFRHGRIRRGHRRCGDRTARTRPGLGAGEFLIPFEGTPLGNRWDLTPERCIRILALFRFFFPDVEVRLAGGREIHLRSLQPLALHLANSIFLGDYLTSEGQPGIDDRQMITDAGFTVEGAHEQTLPQPRHDLVALRRRGAGTDQPANA
ncbi:hypothetical protein [Nocardia sp. GAS34]|uniref:hypothetical protein n=1 Tax=unclassified Nocardia TaxID=2637762 RepID=UPI003D1B4FEB